MWACRYVQLFRHVVPCCKDPVNYIQVSKRADTASCSWQGRRGDSTTWCYGIAANTPLKGGTVSCKATLLHNACDSCLKSTSNGSGHKMKAWGRCGAQRGISSEDMHTPSHIPSLTNVRAHACTHAHAQRHTRMYTYTSYTCTHKQTHTHTSTSMCARTSTCKR